MGHISFSKENSIAIIAGLIGALVLCITGYARISSQEEKTRYHITHINDAGQTRQDDIREAYLADLNEALMAVFESDNSAKAKQGTDSGHAFGTELARRMETGSADLLARIPQQAKEVLLMTEGTAADISERAKDTADLFRITWMRTEPVEYDKLGEPQDSGRHEYIYLPNVGSAACSTLEGLIATCEEIGQSQGPHLLSAPKAPWASDSTIAWSIGRLKSEILDLKSSLISWKRCMHVAENNRRYESRLEPYEYKVAQEIADCCSRMVSLTNTLITSLTQSIVLIPKLESNIKAYIELSRTADSKCIAMRRYMLALASSIHDTSFVCRRQASRRNRWPYLLMLVLSGGAFCAISVKMVFMFKRDYLLAHTT